MIKSIERVYTRTYADSGQVYVTCRALLAQREALAHVIHEGGVSLFW